MGSRNIVIQAGVDGNLSGGFAINSLVVDNFTPDWLYFPDVGQYVPPASQGTVLAGTGQQTMSYAWQAPPGAGATPYPSMGSYGMVSITDGVLQPAAGTSLAETTITSGTVDIGTITGPVDVSGSTVDLAPGTSVDANITNASITADLAAGSVIEVSSGAVNISGGQGGTTTNVGVESAPVKLTSGTVPGGGSVAPVVTVPAGAVGLVVSCFAVSVNGQSGGGTILVTGDTTSSQYGEEVSSPPNLPLDGVFFFPANPAVDPDMVVTIGASSTVGISYTISAFFTPSVVNVNNGPSQPVLVKGVETALNSGLFPSADLSTQGPNAAALTGVDQVVLGAAPQHYLALNEVTITYGTSVPIIGGVAGQSIRIRKVWILFSSVVGGAALLLGDGAGNEYLFLRDDISVGPWEADFEGLPGVPGNSLEFTNFGSATNAPMNGYITYDLY